MDLSVLQHLRRSDVASAVLVAASPRSCWCAPNGAFLRQPNLNFPPAFLFRSTAARAASCAAFLTSFSTLAREACAGIFGVSHFFSIKISNVRFGPVCGPQLFEKGAICSASTPSHAPKSGSRLSAVATCVDNSCRRVEQTSIFVLRPFSIQPRMDRPKLRMINDNLNFQISTWPPI